MKITLLAVGRVRSPAADSVRDYEQHAGRYWKLDVVEVDAGAAVGKVDPDAVRAAEEERLLPRIAADAEVVALTRGGRPMGSRAFASHLQDHALQGRDVCFVIGGAYGLGQSVLGRAHRLTLSSMTFPHELARLLLAEQLYRAGTILRGEPYHKGP